MTHYQKHMETPMGQFMVEWLGPYHEMDTKFLLLVTNVAQDSLHVIMLKELTE